MAKLALSKSGLQKEKQQLKLYTKLLPSLDLQTFQLTSEHTRTKTELTKLQQEFQRAMAEACEQFADAGTEDVTWRPGKISSYEVGEEYCGNKVPVLRKIYSRF